MALQSLILPILSVFRSAGLQQASGVLNRLTGNFDSLAGKIGLAAGSFSAFSALTTARQFAIESVNATQLFERNLLALNQVFEELQPRMVAFTKEVENYGLSQSQAAQASVFLGSVLKQYGFSVTETAGQTERLVTLAQDLATTYGYDVQEALLAITALFRGEYDPIEKFGVAMKQNEVNARLAAQGLDDLEGAELANAQAIARLDMLFERAGDSLGAFTRATDTLYGSQQRLNAIIGNLQIAVGAPLQEPLAKVNNLFAGIFEDSGQGLVQIFEAIGQTIDVVAPVIGELTRMLLNVIQPLQQIINIFTGLLGPAITLLVVPAFLAINETLETFNDLLDGVSANIALLELNFKRFIAVLESNQFFKDLIDALKMIFSETNPLIQLIGWLGDEFEKSGDAARAAAGDFDVYNGGAKAASVAARRAGYDARDAKDSFKELDVALRGAATGAVDAEGKLQGLAGVFQRIDEAIAQSQAKQALEDLGFSAGFIEEVLTRPNWKEIFGAIAEYARLAAIEIGGLFDRFDFLIYANIEKDKAALLKRINELFGVTKTSGAPKKAAKDTVKDFFDNITDEVKKQTAREQLKVMGASAGLIEAILGAENWLKLWTYIKGTKGALEDLQKEFNKTAAGIAEIDEAFAKNKKELEDWDAANQRIQDDLDADLARIREKADAARLAVSDLLEGFNILPTIEREVGRFESQVTQMLASIESSLRSAFRNKDIFEAGYNELRKYAQLELEQLRKIGEQRDELVKRYDLAKGLIDNYKRAFTAAMDLTSLFGKLKDETEKRTVTVVTSGVVRLGTALREFGVTITKSYEEPIAKMQNKTQGLIDEFRTMADKARAFAANLRKLEEMGLNGELFNDLVEAGVVAGGETAQALVDGGKETVDEINDLFKEINALGADMGEEIASTMYSTGIDMVDGLLEGIRSKQQELEEQARNLAEAFNREFQSRFNIQVGMVQSAAEQAALDKANEAWKKLGPRPEELPQVPKVDTAALRQLDALIAGATRYVGNVADATQKLGGEIKLEIYKDLYKAVEAGTAVDLSGIRSGMSSAELAAAARAAAPTTVTNNFNIAPGNRLQQNETVETLRSFVNQNGSLVGFGIV